VFFLPCEGTFEATYFLVFLVIYFAGLMSGKLGKWQLKKLQRQKITRVRKLDSFPLVASTASF
jgi:cytochrome oxidase assembly protein ShyY1